MQVSGVCETTATTGTDTITCAGAFSARHMQFEEGFVSGDVVPYRIEDGNNWEIGIGTLTTGGSWTLSRDQIFEKWDGGVYSKWPATGINLSGSATVGITPSAASIRSPAVIGLVGGSTYDLFDNVEQHSTTLSLPSASDGYFCAARLSSPRKMSTLAVNVTVASATAALEIGIYTVGSDGKPGRLICKAQPPVDTTTLASDTIDGGGSVYLNPGNYFVAWAIDEASVVSLTAAAKGDWASGGGLNMGMDAQFDRPFWYQNSVNGILPASASVSAYLNAGNVPGVFFKP